MPRLEIIRAGLMTSIQDTGRRGLAYYAIPPSGAMDIPAAKIALLLLRQSEEAPLIECTSLAPHILFHDAGEIALSGADFSWRLNDQSVTIHTVIKIQAGDILKGQVSRNGLRGYIAVRGQLQIEKMYNSYATYINAKLGGYQGRLLQKGDVLTWEDRVDAAHDYPTLRIFPGPEFTWLSPESRATLSEQIYRVGADSNRMGLRLEGPGLDSQRTQLTHSAPVLPGFIQLPPSGLPIIVLQDGQTTGGYPRIAYIREIDLPLLNQVPLRGKLAFRWAID